MRCGLGDLTVSSLGRAGQYEAETCRKSTVELTTALISFSALRRVVMIHLRFTVKETRLDNVSNSVRSLPLLFSRFAEATYSHHNLRQLGPDSLAGRSVADPSAEGRPVMTELREVVRGLSAVCLGQVPLHVRVEGETVPRVVCRDYRICPLRAEPALCGEGLSRRR